jgi:ABC-type Na+ efflux pump permease subunit
MENRTEGNDRRRQRLSKPLAAWACFLLYIVLAQLNWRPSKAGTFLELIPFATGLYLALSSLGNRRARIAGLLLSVVYLVMVTAMIIESWDTYWRDRF